jgi:hypothetical protein
MTSDAAPLEQFAAVSAALATVAPSHFGHHALARHDAPPRYVWVPTIDDFDREVWIGANPKSYGALLQHFEIHCWARDYAAAWRMRQALVTVFRRAISITYELKSATWAPHADSALGWVCTQTLCLHIPLPEAEIPIALGKPITDRVRRTVRLRNAAFDTSGERDGDGVLVPPDK